MTLNWNAPPDNGGSAITDYEYRLRLTGETAWGAWTSVGSPTATSHTVTGLVNGSGYDFEVRALNIVGAGVESAPANRKPPRPPDNDDGGGGDGEPLKASVLFEDVQAGVWYEPAAPWMILHRITAGCTPTLLCADANLTRQQFVTFLWRAAGRPTPPYLGSEAFDDVTKGGYAEQSIGWAVANDITQGCTPGQHGGPTGCSVPPKTSPAGKWPPSCTATSKPTTPAAPLQTPTWNPTNTTRPASVG